MPAFSFISVGYLFINLSRSTFEKIHVTCCVKGRHEESTVCKIKEFANMFLFYNLSISECSDQISRKMIKSTYPVNSLECQRVALEMMASDGFCHERQNRT